MTNLKINIYIIYEKKNDYFQTSSWSVSFLKFSHSIQNWIFSWLNSFFKNSVKTCKPISSWSNLSKLTAHDVAKQCSSFKSIEPSLILVSCWKDNSFSLVIGGNG